MPKEESRMTAAEIYDRLYEAYGAPRWWSDDPYTVMVQAILVQNTSWSSVVKVSQAFSGLLTPSYILGLSMEELQELIRPCGFSKAKSSTIIRITEWFCHYDYDTSKLKVIEQEELRNNLLNMKGIGAETADVILVFAFHKPSFIIDAYTRRLLKRLGGGFQSDKEIRTYIHLTIEKDYRLYGWFHWLILMHGIECCKKVPMCTHCCMREICVCRTQ